MGSLRSLPLTIDIAHLKQDVPCQELLTSNEGCIGHTKRQVGSQFPNQGSNPRPLQWKHGVLTTGHQGSPWRMHFEERINLFLCYGRIRMSQFLNTITSSNYSVNHINMVCCCTELRSPGKDGPGIPTYAHSVNAFPFWELNSMFRICLNKVIYQFTCLFLSQAVSCFEDRGCVCSVY